MKKNLLVCFILCSAVITNAWAQGRTVSGTVISQEDGEGLPGVNVILKGTTSGTVTDIDGMYKIDVASDDAVLLFSSIGFLSQEIIVGTKSVIDLDLAPDIQQLSEVVVTALGIEREAKDLGYSVSGVKSEDLVVARETNVVNALQGKVTGVNITSSSGNLGGSSKITVRGVSSLSGRNNPLWVVDGVPINNQQNQGGDINRITGNRDFANGAAVINPDDVESINVLKGAAATALYGSRAAAGVIVVTTKRGKAGAGGGPSVSLNSSVRFDDLFRTPDFQNEYAGGSFYKYDSAATANSFGARIIGQPVRKAITHEEVPLQAYPDNMEDFYQTGKTLINNFAISDANERGDYRLSLTSLNQTGILPGAELDRLTASFNAGFKHSDKLKSRFSAQYIRTVSEGTGVAGANDPNIIGPTQWVRTVDTNDFLPWIDESGNQINTISPNDDNNPYWIQHENKNDREDDRFLGNFELTFTPIEKLNITSRVGYDFDVDERLITNRVGTKQVLGGDFENVVIQRRQLNVDIIGNYLFNLNDELTLSVLGGWNFNRRVFERDVIASTDQSIPELFLPSNSLVSNPDRDFSEQKLFGLYGEAVLSYRDWLSLTVTARNDWSSTLPLDNNSYFYPSISAAWVYTDALGISGSFLSYGKLRASWAQVGNDASPYLLDFTFLPRTEANGQYGLNLSFPYDGRLGFRKTNTIPNQDLVPEQQTTIELGAEFAFLDGRIGLDIAYFDSENKNQILQTPIPETTGFGFRTQNVGTISQEGVEISLNADVLKIGDFTWNTIVNFSHVESKVEELVEGTDRIVIASAFNSVQLVAVPGKEFQLFGFDYARDEATGRPLIDPTNGRRIAGEQTLFGSVFPDYTMGFLNTFTYKGLQLTATVDYSSGGKIRSATVEALWDGGYTVETAQNREGTYIDTEGLIQNDDGTTRENDVPVRSTYDFWETFSDASVSQATIYDASYVKLREIGISYTLPKRIFANNFIESLQVGIEGRNLALLYSKVPHIDPEANLFGSGSSSGRDGFGIERNIVPSVRGLGFNVRLTF